MYPYRRGRRASAGITIIMGREGASLAAVTDAWRSKESEHILDMIDAHRL
jgi:hypothetical protein